MTVNYFIKRILEKLHLSEEHNAVRKAAKINRARGEDFPVKKINHPVELVSIHIPKTAGTSFYEILQGAYGKNNVVRVDYKPHLKNLVVNKKIFTKQSLPEPTRVIHGHIHHKALKAYFDLPDDVKIITWIRNPVERIISDYFYVKSLVNERYSFDPYNPKIMDRMLRSLPEFAAQEKEQNRISRFLGDVGPEDFDFMGIMEYFEEDMKFLSNLLGWKSYKIVTVNKTKNKSHDISEEVYEKIKDLNKKDMDLYNNALEMRSTRLKKSKND